jgi:hypothetical protein
MQLLNIFTPVLLIGSMVGATVAHGLQTNLESQRALSLLAVDKPRVNWNPASVLSADFDHDGKDDFAFSGTEEGKFVVAIIRSSIPTKSRYSVFRFSIKSPSLKIDQICSLDAKIRTRSPVIVGSAKGTWRIPLESKAIFLDDGCDPIDISWDQEKQKFERLRIHVLL